MTIDSFSGEYHFLSNFYPSPVVYEDVEYPSSEHAYQAAKSLSHNTRTQVLQLTAGQSKKWGRTILLRDDWEDVKYAVMQDIVNRKFAPPKVSLRFSLAMTHPHELIEGNWWGDTYWGVCKGVGQNNLGKILMTIRNEIMFGEES